MRVEEETLKRGHSGCRGGRSIQPVAENRVADAGQMDAYLVSAAGSDTNPNERATRKLLKHLVFGIRRPTRT